jgi:hypothetical protein
MADDIDAVVALLTDDAWMSMPPSPLEYQGHPAITAFLLETANWRGERRYKLIPTRANTQPAFGCYCDDKHTPIEHAFGLLVMTLEGERIAAITNFIDSSVLPRFGLPRTLRLLIPRVRAGGSRRPCSRPRRGRPKTCDRRPAPRGKRASRPRARHGHFDVPSASQAIESCKRQSSSAAAGGRVSELL